jgi:hypothetical protein
MPGRAATPPKASPLSTLLGLWRGDSYTTGWASPTLALEIARQVEPKDVQVLANVIYPPRDGQSQVPNDPEIIKFIKEGYKLWKQEQK